MSDLSDKYNTELSKEDEAKFQTWLTDNKRAGDLSNYDLRGWWKQNGTQDARGHFSDEFKKPNHPTFSTESKYNGEDSNIGGEWVGDDEKGWKFKASKSNVDNMTKEGLQKYFTETEPDAELIMPEPDPEDAPAPTRAERWYGK